MSRVVDEHRQYVADEMRVTAFRRAIRDVVRPGDVVVDLGAGTGILGLLACQAGAARVYSIEDSGMIELARAICRANEFDDRVHFIKGLFNRITLPEPADVVVGDLIGWIGLDGGLWNTFCDASRRFLKPGGVTIPSRMDLYVTAVECSDGFEQVEFWNRTCSGLNFQAARALAVNTGYPYKFCPLHLLGDAAMIASLSPSSMTAAGLSLEASVTIGRAGMLHGIGAWFSAQLSDNVTMTNSPLATDSINRRNVFFPVDAPVSVQPGDQASIRLHVLPSEVMVTWKLDVRDAGGASKAQFTHSTLKGMLIAKEDLQKTRRDFVPTLSPWGDARLLLLSLCNGQRSLGEIEEEVYQRYPELFSTLGEAAAFVAEVMTRYAV